ncbi:MAG: hypothetical protein ACMXYA_02765, partial [Candidatus Woesearchaeota archaeon]
TYQFYTKMLNLGKDGFIAERKRYVEHLTLFMSHQRSQLERSISYARNEFGEYNFLQTQTIFPNIYEHLPFTDFLSYANFLQKQDSPVQRAIIDLSRLTTEFDSVAMSYEKEFSHIERLLQQIEPEFSGFRDVIE